jgi:hypothetical protein
MYRLKLTLVCIILCNVFAGFSQKKNITINLTYYQPYCGGARPTKEIEAEAAKSKPYANKMVMVVSNVGKVDSIKSNADGVIKLRLKRGTYKIYEAWRYYKTSQDGLIAKYDAECLKAEWQKEYYTITVSKNEFVITEVNQIINNCSWNRFCLKDEFKQVPE